MIMKFIVFFLHPMTMGLSALCFPESIPESDRQYIQDQAGLPAPIRIGSYWWASAIASNALLDLLISEVLGYHTAPVVRVDWAPMEAILLLMAGCTSQNCSQLSEPVHILLDGPVVSRQDHNLAAPAILESFRSDHPSRAIENLGTQYVYTTSIFIKDSIKKKAFEDAALPLEYYRSYNSSVNQPHRFFHGLADLAKEDFVFCNDTSAGTDFIDTGMWGNYLTWTGDTDGLIETPEGFVAKCYDEYFWLAPACRSDPSLCIPVVVSYFDMITTTQWATVHHLPLAFARHKPTISKGQLLQKYDVLAVGLEPDPFSDPTLKKTRLVLPPYNASEYLQGNFQSANEDTPAMKYGSILLQRFAPEVKGLVEGVVTGLEVQRKLLTSMPGIIDPTDQIQIDLDSQQFFERQEEARNKMCEWAKLNRDVWEPWMPIVTNCIGGFGLVDGQDLPVDRREDAVRCKLCPPGRSSQFYADLTGPTHRCVSCLAGQHQSQIGKTQCEPCDPGTFAAIPGQVLCSPCAPGSYASTGGLTSCLRCNNTDQTTAALIEDSWIEIPGATSESFCRCMAGRFLDEGACTPCGVGTSCPGSDFLELLPGFHSTADNPGFVFQCFGDPSRCPGGPPGTCASGRDSNSRGCSECLPGLQPHGAECIPCSGSDYFELIAYALLVLFATGMLHTLFFLGGHGYRNRLQNWLVTGALCLSQLITFAQVLAVIRKIQSVQWADPFTTLLGYLNLLSLENLLNSVRSISCLTSFTPEIEFLTRAFLVPLFFAMGPILSHIFCVVVTKKPTWQARLLPGTLGSLCLLFFIMICFVCVEPFRCNLHPSGFSTMQTAPSIVCNFADEHLRLSIVGVALLMLPLSFLALCTWIILHELPKRVAKGDTDFIQLTSFLTMRFKPGFEVFAVIFLVRNVIVPITPMLSSVAASILVMGVILIASVALVSYYKPWRSLLPTMVDLSGQAVLLLILLLATFNVTEQDQGSMMVLCTVAVCLLLVFIVVAAGYCAVQYLKTKYRKQFRFFLCHHRAATAAFARWLKMELQGCGARSFIDLDSLTDLTTLFSYVSSQVETLVILGSPAIVTRKWCVGEMVTAKLSNVETVLVRLPNFRHPKETFIKQIATHMPEAVQLAAYGYGLSEVKATLRWLTTLRTIRIDTVSAMSMGQLVGELTHGSKIQAPGLQRSGGCILADHDDSEAISSAHVLARFLRHTMVDKGILVTVLGAEKPETQLEQIQPSIMILLCSQNCLKSRSVANCVLKVRFLNGCSVLPVISDEGFVVPSQTGAPDALGIEDPEDADAYRSVLAAVFLEVALPFMPGTSSEDDLAIRASHIARRFSPGNLKTLRSKLWMTSSASHQEHRDSDSEGSGESILAILGNPVAVDNKQVCPDKDDDLSADLEDVEDVKDVEEEMVVKEF